MSPQSDSESVETCDLNKITDKQKLERSSRDEENDIKT